MTSTRISQVSAAAGAGSRAVPQTPEPESYDERPCYQAHRGPRCANEPSNPRGGKLSGLVDCEPPGDPRAVDMLFAETYGELRKLASARLRGGYQDTLLSATELVHESYLRLAGAGHLDLQDRVHFIGYAGRAMRSVIVDWVRKRQSSRRGGGAGRVELNAQIVGEVGAGAEQILRIHEALEDLARFDPRMARVVEMRYFAGMTEAETAAALAITDRTVRREWEKARLWLAEALS